MAEQRSAHFNYIQGSGWEVLISLLEHRAVYCIYLRLHTVHTVLTAAAI